MTTPDFDKLAAEIQGQLMRACTDQTGAVFSCFCELSDEALVMIAAALREMYEQGLADNERSAFDAGFKRGTQERNAP